MTALTIPPGELVRSRVVTDPATPLAGALERSLTGYARLEPQEALLLGDGGPAVVTFDDGVPVLAYHAGADAGGPAALAELGAAGPLRAELYRVDDPALAAAHDADALRVPPGMPAERLAGDPDLAERTRAAAPPEGAADGGTDPLAAFLADDERVAAIQEEARREARERAAEWGLDGELE
jgi:hypothetical protein